MDGGGALVDSGCTTPVRRSLQNAIPGTVRPYTGEGMQTADGSVGVLPTHIATFMTTYHCSLTRHTHTFPHDWFVAPLIPFDIASDVYLKKHFGVLIADRATS